MTGAAATMNVSKRRQWRANTIRVERARLAERGEIVKANAPRKLGPRLAFVQAMLAGQAARAQR